MSYILGLFRPLDFQCHKPAFEIFHVHSAFDLFRAREKENKSV